METGSRPAPLGISFSQVATFEECPRRYAMRTLADRLPAPERWEVKLQGRLAPWTTVAGKLVDEAIAAALRHYRREGEWPEDLYALALQLASEWWRYSRVLLEEVRTGQPCTRSSTWQPLDRHYYEEEVGSEELRHLRERVRLCLENWQNSPLPEWIAGFDPSGWQGPREPGERVAQFDLGGVRVWAAPDFAVQSDETTWILDWKTGSPGTAAYLRAREQLQWYGLLAWREWGVPPEELRLVSVWLQPEYATHEFTVTREELLTLGERIRERHAVLAGLLHLAADGEAPLEVWPLTEHLPLCRSCPFRGSCPGASRLREAPAPAPEEDPFTDG